MASESRRLFMQSAAAASLIAATGAANRAPAAEERTAGSAAAGGAFDLQRAPVPLPFAANALNGLSEKLIQSHWENNYQGAVRALNTVEQRLDAMAQSVTTMVDERGFSPAIGQLPVGCWMLTKKSVRLGV